jgi:hypothetical protein
MHLVETKDDQSAVRDVIITGYTHCFLKICFIISTLFILRKDICIFYIISVKITGDFETGKEMVSSQISRFFYLTYFYLLLYRDVTDARNITV